MTDYESSLDLHLYQALALLAHGGSRARDKDLVGVLSAIYAGEPGLAASEMWTWALWDAETPSLGAAKEELRAAYNLMGLEPPS